MKRIINLLLLAMFCSANICFSQTKDVINTLHIEFQYKQNLVNLEKERDLGIAQIEYQNPLIKMDIELRSELSKLEMQKHYNLYVLNQDVRQDAITDKKHKKKLELIQNEFQIKSKEILTNYELQVKVLNITHEFKIKEIQTEANLKLKKILLDYEAKIKAYEN